MRAHSHSWQHATVPYLSFLILALSGAAGGCASGGEGPVLGDALEGGSPMESRPVLERAHSELEEEVRTVVRDDRSWRRFLDEALGSVPGDDHAVDPVDFRERMVIAAGMGRRPTGGFQLKITGVYHRNDSVFVGVQHLLPGKNCMVTQAITSPVEAVSVPTRPGPVRFVVEERTLYCSR